MNLISIIRKKNFEKEESFLRLALDLGKFNPQKSKLSNSNRKSLDKHIANNAFKSKGNYRGGEIRQNLGKTTTI